MTYLLEDFTPGHTENTIIRNQIDFILIKTLYINGIQSVKTYPNPNADSVHNLLLANVKIRLRRLMKKTKIKNMNLRG